ncbi:hypothetical protein ACIPUD_14980 [Bradyrhizobium sp. CAR08]
MKRAAMSAGEDFGLCKRERVIPAERILDVPVANYQLVRPDII